MKKIMIIATLMVASVSTKAQFDPGTISIQPKIGLGISKVSNIQAKDISSSLSKNYEINEREYLGVIAGLELEYQIIKHLSIAAGVNYSQQGCKWGNNDWKDGNTKTRLKDTKLKLNYINVPVVLNYYIDNVFAIKSGVQFGFLTEANLCSTIESTTSIPKSTFIVQKDSKKTIDENLKDNCNLLDISIPIGVSLQFPKYPVYIDARYNIGITNIQKELGKDAKGSKNQVFQITIGYKFTL